jgi:hypothetical protein
MLNIQPCLEKLPGGEAERNQGFEVFLHRESCDKFRFFLKRKLQLEYLVMHWEAVWEYA